MNLLHAAVLSLMLMSKNHNVPRELEAVPAEVRERATVALIGTYYTGRSPCQFLPNGDRRWYLLAGFRIEKLLIGNFLADYVGINQAMLPEDPLVEKNQDLLPGEKYLVLLRPSAESMKELHKPDPIFAMDNSLHGEEVVAIIPLTPAIERVEIADWGLFERAPEEEERETTEAPATSFGYVHVVPAEATPQVSVQTDRFAAAIGTRFGMLFRVEAEPEADARPSTRIVPIHVRVTHPLTHNPATGAEVTVDEWDAPANIGLVRYTGWVFEADWEIVPGTWTIEVLHRGKVLAKKDFTVTR
jgi:hypothetical protein